MDPCGTPNSISKLVDKTLFNLTNCLRDFRYDAKKFKAFPLIPYFSNLRSKIVWLTESNALARSKNIAQVLSFLSKLLRSFSYMSSTAYSVENLALKPNW